MAGGVEKLLAIDEYFQALVDFHWERVELIEGVVHPKKPTFRRNVNVSKNVATALRLAFPAAQVFEEGSLAMPPDTCLEPDLFVWTGEGRPPHGDPVPASTVALVVEISVTTTSKDLGVKAHLYAQAGIGEYWVVDCSTDQPSLIRHTNPVDGVYGHMAHTELASLARGLDAAAILAS